MNIKRLSSKTTTDQVRKKVERIVLKCTVHPQSYHWYFFSSSSFADKLQKHMILRRVSRFLADTVYNINVTRAESMPLYRQVPDSRPKGCQAIKYDTCVRKLHL